MIKSFKIEIFFKLLLIMNSMIILFGLAVVSAICIFLLYQSIKNEKYYNKELNNLNSRITQLGN